MKEKRQNETPEQKAVRLAAMAESQRIRRLNRTLERAEAERAACARRIQEKRQNETPEQKALRMAADAERHRIRRHNQAIELQLWGSESTETPDNLEATESPEQGSFLETLGLKASSENEEFESWEPGMLEIQISCPEDEEQETCQSADVSEPADLSESSDAKFNIEFIEEHLKKGREEYVRKRQLRQNETPEEKAARRRAAEAERKMKKRQTQSAEKAAAERAACAKRMQEKRKNETPEQKAARRAAGAERQRLKRQKQSAEEAAAERAANAQRMRDARRQRNPNVQETNQEHSFSEEYDSVGQSCDLPDSMDQSCDLPDDEAEYEECLPLDFLEVDLQTDEI